MYCNNEWNGTVIHFNCTCYVSYIKSKHTLVKILIPFYIVTHVLLLCERDGQVRITVELIWGGKFNHYHSVLVCFLLVTYMKCNKKGALYNIVWKTQLDHFKLIY